MKAYKGFNKDMTCRGFQYEEGKEYETEEASLCSTGFHACENPLDCLAYYAPADSVYHEVELGEVSGDTDDDSKRCAKKIKIGAKVELLDIIKATFEYVKEHCTSEKHGDDRTCLTGGDWSALNGGDWSALNGGDRSALNGGDCSALKGGYWSALNGGDWSALNGGDGSALNGGDGSALNGGYRSALNGGYRSALNGGYRSALNGGDWSALNGGDRSALNGGYRSALNGGNRSALNGGNRSVVYGGEGAKVKGGMRSVLAIQHWRDCKFIRIAFAEVDGEKIKADTWYKLDENGEFVEVE